jgi:Bacterial PH domain
MDRKTVEDVKLWSNANFPNKIDENEDIIFIVREDIAILFFNTLKYFAVFFALFLIHILLLGYLEKDFLDIFDSLFYIANVILLTLYTMYFHNYYLSVQIVTSERIIDVDQQGLFSREVNELPIDNIQDVTHKQNGIWSTMFNFGDVVVQSASEGAAQETIPGEKPEISGFVFNNVPNPSEISNTIATIRHQNKEAHMKNTAFFNAQAMKDVQNDN